MIHPRCGVCTTYVSGYFFLPRRLFLFTFSLVSVVSGCLGVCRPPTDAHLQGCRGGAPGCCVSPVCTACRLKADTFFFFFCFTAAAAATEAAAHAQSRSLPLQHPLQLTVCTPGAKAKLAWLRVLLRFRLFSCLFVF